MASKLHPQLVHCQPMLINVLSSPILAQLILKISYFYKYFLHYSFIPSAEDGDDIHIESRCAHNTIIGTKNSLNLTSGGHWHGGM